MLIVLKLPCVLTLLLIQPVKDFITMKIILNFFLDDFKLKFNQYYLVVHNCFETFYTLVLNFVPGRITEKYFRSKFLNVCRALKIRAFKLKFWENIDKESKELTFCVLSFGYKRKSNKPNFVCKKTSYKISLFFILITH